MYMLFIIKLQDYYKIGKTKQLRIRLLNLRSQSGNDLYIIMYIELECNYDENYSHIESFLHAYFSKKRLAGEWFKLNIRDLINIESLFYSIEGWYMQSLRNGIDNIKKGIII